MAYTYNLVVKIETFDCCGSASVTRWYGDGDGYVVRTDNEGIAKLLAVEAILIRDRRNLAIAVITHKQAKNFKKYLDARGWLKVGESVKNSKTNNYLETWMLDLTSRKTVDILPPPEPPKPVTGFSLEGVRLDRRDEPRTAEVGPRKTTNDDGHVKEFFVDINNHRVMFVDLPVFARGVAHDRHLNFYSIRLANGGNSYSWLQGGAHRFPQGLAGQQPPLMDDDIEEEDEDL